MKQRRQKKGWRTIKVDAPYFFTGSDLLYWIALAESEGFRGHGITPATEQILKLLWARGIQNTDYRAKLIRWKFILPKGENRLESFVSHYVYGSRVEDWIEDDLPYTHMARCNSKLNKDTVIMEKDMHIKIIN